MWAIWPYAGPGWRGLVEGEWARQKEAEMNHQSVPTGAVLVGYDGSPGARVALDWALAEAIRFGAPVHLRYAFEWVSPAGVFAPVPQSGSPDLRAEARSVVNEAVAAATATHPDLEIGGDVVDGTAAGVLCDASRYARTVVVGHSGPGGFSGLLHGSVGVAVTAHAHCPVVVVRGRLPADAALPVWVGVDGSRESQLAVGFAFDAAARRGVPVAAVHAWDPPPVSRRNTVQRLSYDPVTIEAAERQLLDEDLAPWRDKYPQLTVTTSTVPVRPGQALVDVSRRAQLVVVGCRGRGGFRGLLLGSVSQRLVHHAACPVAVIRETHT
jgi:nucleotide-binding universal stress UspA family protein